MKVSIIVPVYNTSIYLTRCIESLLNQSYQDIEILLINDGSTDDSLKICKEFEAKNNNVHCYSKKNEGLGLTRTFGINRASGQFIVFIDSDDIVTSNLIESLITEQNKANYDMVISGQARIDLEDNIISSRPYEKRSFFGSDIKDTLLPMLIGSNPSEHDSISVSACGVLYRTSIIIQHSLSFKSEREYISEDLLFNIEYINHCRSIVLLDICGYYYRMNQNSLTTSYRKDRFTKTKYIYEVQKEMLINIGVYEQCKYRLMKQFFIYLRLCISQENTKLSNLHINDAIRHISTICHDTLVGKLIDEYPVYKLGIRQQIYIRLIKTKQSLILYLLVLLKKI